MTENLKPTIQNKINFIIEKCGGNSLSHILNNLHWVFPKDDLTRARIGNIFSSLLY